FRRCPRSEIQRQVGREKAQKAQEILYVSFVLFCGYSFFVAVLRRNRSLTICSSARFATSGNKPIRKPVSFPIVRAWMARLSMRRTKMSQVSLPPVLV